MKLVKTQLNLNTLKLMQFTRSTLLLVKLPLMTFIGALISYKKFLEKLHINLKPFDDLLHENTPWS